MRIISKKALRVGRGLNEMIIRPKTETVCPDWVNDDPLFQMAVKAGDIMSVNHPAGSASAGLVRSPAPTVPPVVVDTDDSETKGKKKS